MKTPKQHRMTNCGYRYYFRVFISFKSLHLWTLQSSNIKVSCPVSLPHALEPLGAVSLWRFEEDDTDNWLGHKPLYKVGPRFPDSSPSGPSLAAKTSNGQTVPSNAYMIVLCMIMFFLVSSFGLGFSHFLILSFFYYKILI